MTSFDNRTFLNRAGLDPLQRLTDRARRQGDLHLICEVGGLTLGYCYIRKNACSSFKRLFIEHAEVPYDPAVHPRKIDFMIAHQMMRSADAPRCDRIVFVYRDPFARAASLYKNKFVTRDGHEDIFASYAAITGRDPDTASFRDFVELYLRPDMRDLDPHVAPQAAHLKHFRYTDAIPIGDLHGRMTEILGADLADAYFKRPVNATRSTRTIDDPGMAELPARDLAKAFAECDEMPSDAALLIPPLHARLADLYAADVALIAAVEARAPG